MRDEPFVDQTLNSTPSEGISKFLRICVLLLLTHNHLWTMRVCKPCTFLTCDQKETNKNEQQSEFKASSSGNTETFAAGTLKAPFPGDIRMKYRIRSRSCMSTNGVKVGFYLIERDVFTER
ncbi:hypothetical protein RRG08_058534 [Elysia crispata]|uniref:Uncharacterized protein n=1 Tax=Elysia crispata TaxID=231223 RepID=A0AAE1DYQ2_9GAST|nr:hypothetical protein RRG08_058534 [Elysia crispata]